MISRYVSLAKILSGNASAFLLGPRGTGKTSLVRAFRDLVERSGGRALSIDLLSLRTARRYEDDPGLFRSDILFALGAEGSLLVVVDEVQKAPYLLDEVHYLLEAFPGRIQFLLTGSSARKLRRGGANLLAGRALSLALHPLSLLDIPPLDTPFSLERALQFGTLPRYYLGEREPDETIARLLDGYVETYLKEEIQAERLVRGLSPFHRFLEIAAQMNGQMVNFSAIARQLRVSDQTVRDYYTILLHTLLAFELPSWSRSVRRKLALASRFYLFDCGVINAILGEQSIAPRAGTGRFGRLFEAFIVTEFFRQSDYLGTRRSLYGWRTQRGEYEVDILIDRGIREPPIGVEIKSSTEITIDDLTGLTALAAEFPSAPLYCICRTERPYQLEVPERRSGGNGAQRELNVSVVPWESGVTEILMRAMLRGEE